MGSLNGLEREDRLPESEVAPFVSDLVLGPEPARQRQHLEEARDALLHRHAEAVELLGPVAETAAEDEAAFGDHVEG
jgi:hypothetical protein